MRTGRSDRPEPDRGRTDRFPEAGLLLALLGLAGLTGLAFANAAPNVFVFDDLHYLPIPRRPGESWTELGMRLLSGDPWPGRRLGSQAYRPLTFLTLAIDGALHGNRPAGFHQTSILLHLGVTAALFLLLFELLRGEKAGRSGLVAATVAAAVFAVHPVHVESVACAFNRGDLLVSLFLLAAVPLVRRESPARRGLIWLGVAILTFLALLSKESAAMMPFLLLALHLPFRTGPAVVPPGRESLPFLVLLLPLGVFLGMRHVAMEETTWGSEAWVGAAEGVAMSVTAVRDMLGLFLWPHPLRAVRSDYVATALPLGLLVLAGLGAAIALAWRRYPGIAAGLLFFLLALLPTLPFVTRMANAQIFAERYLYLPSIGLVIALGFALREIGRRWGPVTVLLPTLPILGVLLLLTRDRNEAWHGDIPLFEAELAAAPDNPLALVYLEMSYAEAGRLEDSLALCKRHAEAPSPGRERFFQNCGLRLERRGQLAAAEAFFRKGARGDAPPSAYYTYARLLVRRGRAEEAREQYERALAITLDPLRQQVLRAEMLFKLEPTRRSEALELVEAALAREPGFALALELRRRILASPPRP